MITKWDPSKWELHQLYAKHYSLGKRLPPSSVLSKDNLLYFLDKYKEVYIKGINQHTGSGIIKAWKTENGYGFIKERGEPEDVYSIYDLYDKVRDGRPRDSILIQKSIDLASINGRPFSIRVMLMRDRKRIWQYAGMLAKVSGEGSIITNVRRGGGYAATTDDALAQSLGYNRERIASVKRKLVRVSFETIHHAMNKGYRSHEAGIDLGIDRNGKIWIIEVNLVYPSYGLFNRLDDKTFYQKIKKLAEDYKKSKK